jgi:hypothetical protein
MKDARKFEIKIEVPSLKAHSVRLPLELVVKTDRPQTLGTRAIFS